MAKDGINPKDLLIEMSKYGDQEKVWDFLKRNKIAEAHVHFSGGNDEGGAHDFQLFDKAGKEMSYKLDDEMMDLLASPMDDAYGSFAGEFQVSGSFIWKTKTKKITEDSDYQDTERGDEEDGYSCAC